MSGFVKQFGLTTSPFPAMLEVVSTYPGGKGGAGVAQALINLMPPHSLYVEPFLGGGKVLRTKRPAVANVGVDRSPAALEATMRDLSSSVLALSDRLPANLAIPAGSGIYGDAAGGIGITGDGGPLLDPLARSGDTHRRISPNLTLLQGCGIQWIETNAAALEADVLIYCDPPYVRDTRRGKRDLYEFEMTDGEHVKLLNALKALRCKVMVSGYWSGLYASLLTGWSTATFQTTVRSGATAEEWVWFNYPQPVELHDYRFLGSNFREREGIKRKMKRWKERLAKMPELERQALLWAMRGSDGE